MRYTKSAIETDTDNDIYRESAANTRFNKSCNCSQKTQSRLHESHSRLTS